MIAQMDTNIMLDQIFDKRKQIRPVLMALYDIDAIFQNEIRIKVYNEIFNSKENEKNFMDDCMRIFSNQEIVSRIEEFLNEKFGSVNAGTNFLCQNIKEFDFDEIDDPLVKVNLETYSIMNELRNIGIYSIDMKKKIISKNVLHYPWINANFLASKLPDLTYKTVNSALNNELVISKFVKKKIDSPMGKGRKQYINYQLTDYGIEICFKMQDKSSKHGRLYHIEKELLELHFLCRKTLKSLKGKDKIKINCINIERFFKIEDYVKILIQFDKELKIENLLTDEILPDDIIDRLEVGRAIDQKQLRKLIVERNQIFYFKKLFAFIKSLINIVETEIRDIQSLIEQEFDEISNIKFEEISDEFVSKREINLTQISMSVNPFFNLDRSDFKSMDQLLIQKYENDELKSSVQENELVEFIYNQKKNFYNFNIYFENISAFIREKVQ